jgi:hypothetical protein
MTIDYTALLVKVMEEHPDLATNGWRTSRLNPTDFEVSRADLRSNVWEFHLAYDWCAQLEHRGSAPPHYGYSYQLKHDCEKSVWRYITNGTLIAAMIARGFRYIRQPGNPNCTFFVTIRSVKAATISADIQMEST